MAAGDEKKAEIRTLKLLKNPDVSIFEEGTSRESCMVQVINCFEFKHERDKRNLNIVPLENIERWNEMKDEIFNNYPNLSKRKVSIEIEARCIGQDAKYWSPSETIREKVLKNRKK